MAAPPSHVPRPPLPSKTPPPQNPTTPPPPPRPKKNCKKKKKSKTTKKNKQTKKPKTPPAPAPPGSRRSLSAGTAPPPPRAAPGRPPPRSWYLRPGLETRGCLRRVVLKRLRNGLPNRFRKPAHSAHKAGWKKRTLRREADDRPKKGSLTGVAKQTQPILFAQIHGAPWILQAVKKCKDRENHQNCGWFTCKVWRQTLRNKANVPPPAALLDARPKHCKATVSSTVRVAGRRNARQWGQRINCTANNNGEDGNLRKSTKSKKENYWGRDLLANEPSPNKPRSSWLCPSQASSNVQAGHSLTCNNKWCKSLEVRENWAEQ